MLAQTNYKRNIFFIIAVAFIFILCAFVVSPTSYAKFIAVVSGESETLHVARPVFVVEFDETGDEGITIPIDGYGSYGLTVKNIDNEGNFSHVAMKYTISVQFGNVAVINNVKLYYIDSERGEREITGELNGDVYVFAENVTDDMQFSVSDNLLENKYILRIYGAHSLGSTTMIVSAVGEQID